MAVLIYSITFSVASSQNLNPAVTTHQKNEIADWFLSQIPKGVAFIQTGHCPEDSLHHTFFLNIYPQLSELLRSNYTNTT